MGAAVSQEMMELGSKPRNGPLPRTEEEEVALKDEEGGEGTGGEGQLAADCIHPQLFRLLKRSRLTHTGSPSVSLNTQIAPLSEQRLNFYFFPLSPLVPT